MKTACINILFLLLFPFVVLAASDDDAAVDGDTVESEAPVTEHIMLRHEGVVKGFQPLTVAGQEIDATYLEETRGESHGAIVFLHDRGEQFENRVITPLRQKFPEYGWSTLTLALDYPYEPKIYLSTAENGAADKIIAEKESDKPADPEKKEEKAVDASTEEKNQAKTVLPPVSNLERVEAALIFLQSKDVNRIIFVGHGAGGNLAIELLDKIATKVAALVLIATAELTTDQVFKTLEFPILDVFGSNDSESVALAAIHRRKLMKQAGNSRYALRETIGADHVFYGMEPQLTSTLRSWLNKHFVEEATE